MSSLDDLARYHAALRSIDPGNTNDQLLSLTAASQYRFLHDLTLRLVPAGSRVLDWGCGRGHFSYWLLRAGYRVTAYSLEDPPEIFASLEPNLASRLEFVRGSLDSPTDLPFESESFDAVFSVGVLEHVRETGGNEPDALLEIRRILRSGGLFIACHFPNRMSLNEAVSRLLHREPDEEGEFHYHRHRYTREDIRRLVANAGLDLLETHRHGFLPRNSWNRLPRSFHRSKSLTRIVDSADAVLTRLFTPLAQNHWFMARKR
ncbi:MAG: class I SAM-dependent methyltransferase [Acidobacteria bacterium]|nr:class I SAM-dependent methyltransferase [Acidobacteriota bacterium]